MLNVVDAAAVSLACRAQEVTASVAASFDGTTPTRVDVLVISSLHGSHRAHPCATVLRRPRPHSNATPEGRLAATLARARHVVFRHSMDGCVVRTLGSGSRFPQDCDLIMIVAAGRPGGVLSPPGYGVKHGVV